jgi:hypothetical protein
MMRWKRLIWVGASVLSVFLASSMAYAVNTKNLTVTGGNSKPRVKIQVTTPTSQIPTEVRTKDDDDRKAVIALIPEDATNVTITNLDNGKSADLSGPFTMDREVSLAALGLVAPGAAAAATSGWTAAQARGESNWTFDGIVSLGGTSSLGSKDATTTTGGLAINGQSTSGLSGLGGTTGGLMLRAHLPSKWTGSLGDTWVFLRGNYHFDRTGTGGFRNAHNPVPGDETSTKFKRGGDIEFGVGKSVTTYCHEGNVGCQYIGVYFGGSIQQNTITVTSNEIVRQPSFENSAWKPSYVAGVWYSVPLGGIGTGWDNYGLVLGTDFRRVPCMTVNGSTPLPGTYQGHTDAFWEVTTWGGISYTF